MKRAYISVINDLATDQRVIRTAKLLKEQGFDVTCLGRRLKGSPELMNRPYQFRRYRMLFTRGPLFYACFNLRLLGTLLVVKRPSLLIAIDLDTLLAAFLASRIRRVPLIYDSHELFTQVPELIHRKRVQALWKWIESVIVPKLQYAVTVNYSIATIYRRLYKTPFRVVRNAPERISYMPRLKPRKDRQIVLYQGALNMGRGLEMVIDAMKLIPDASFLIAGSGDIEDELKRQVVQHKLEDRVKFKGRMLPEDLLPLTLSADLGISLEEDLGLSYRYSLPNKLLDYIQCRVPVLCSALPEMSRIVDSYGVGIATGERDPEKIAGIIRFMLKERAGGAWMEALDRAAKELCWENESVVYLKLLKECGALN